ncbi:MAG TPA: hypothetical protein VFO46_22460 [Candidatus Sulfotelmatobacter sp.]|nr:hypothetical protein [Candidatus Sulfotelmatobacter sp.]
MRNEQPKFEGTIFLDRTHGKEMATLLRRVGLKVKTIYQVYPKKRHENIKDPQWIAKCGQKGWVAISGDKRIEKNVENKQAVIDAKCKLFLLTDTNSRPEEWASAVILGREKIGSVVRKNEGPFFATISKRSDSHVSNARFPVPRSIPDAEPVVALAVPIAGQIPQTAAEPPVIERERGLFDESEENH